MTDNDKKQFFVVLVTVFELYSKEPSKNVTRLYFESLKQFSIEDIQTAITAHVNDPNQKHFLPPKPADIIRNLPAQLAIEKPSLEPNSCVGLSWCNNTAALVKEYSGKLA